MDNAVLGITMEPTVDGWTITFTHRVLKTGGIHPFITTVPNLDEALTLIKKIVEHVGVETSPPSPPGRV